MCRRNHSTESGAPILQKGFYRYTFQLHEWRSGVLHQIGIRIPTYCDGNEGLQDEAS